MATTPLRIQGGTTLLDLNLWSYTYADVDGVHTVTFTSDVRPKIGDVIQGNVLVVNTEPLINQDKSKWITHPSETWPDDVPTRTIR